MTTLSFKDLSDAIPVLRKKALSFLSKPPIYGLKLRIEMIEPTIFILHGKYYINPFTLLSASYSIDQYGGVEKLTLTHVKGGYNWFHFNQTVINDWISQIIASKFTANIKRELVEKVWHPDRVVKWLDAGIQLEDL